MSDRELLELAAKAAGVEITWGKCAAHADDYDYTGICGPFIGNSGWNPLTDDGDALRLAVKLCLIIEVKEFYLDTDFGIRRKVYVKHHFLDANGEGWMIGFPVEVENKDPYAATRRAIVLAAAEIAKQQ